MLRLRTAALLAVIGLAVSAGCSTSAPSVSPSPSASPVVAEFGGERLTLAEFEDRYTRSAGAIETPSRDSLEAYEDFLRRYVDFRLKVREARRIGLDEDSTVRAEIRDYRNQLAAPYLMEREVMEGILRDLYRKQQEELRASHILLLVDEHASPADTLAAYRRLSAIRDSIVAGSVDFRDAALRHSDDPSRLRNGGDLGYFTGGRMILPFEEMAYETPPGEVSPVFRTQFGYHILRVTDRRPASPEIRASHILLRLSPESSPADSAASFAQLQQLRDRVQAGEPFADLAEAYSQDPGSAGRGGDLGYFTRDRMVEPFAEAAYALEEPGALSEVVETPFGLHLIQLTDRRAPRSYEERYPELKRLAEGLPRTRERRQEVGRSFRAEVGSTLDSVVVREAIAAYAPDSVIAGVYRDGFGSHALRPFATIGDSTITLGDFARALRSQRLPIASDQERQLFGLADQYLNERAVVLATHRLEARDPQFRSLMQDFEEGVLLFRISEDSVWSAATRDSLAVLDYYEAHADRYQYPERRRVVALFSPANSLISQAADLLDSGLEPAEAVRQLRAASEEGGLPLRLDTLHVAPPAEPPFSQALALATGERTEPALHRGEWVLMYVDAVEPPRPKTFEEAYVQVATDYQEEVERRFVERLRREANVRLYPERLREVFSAGSTPQSEDS